MRIIETGFGHKNEAFLERRFAPGINIIFSDDNNKGKTLVIQGMMYAIGNDPIFPSGFNYRDYFFYTKIEINKTEWSFIRKNNSIIAMSDVELFAFDSVSEFKHFFHSKILILPVINKDGRKKIVDLPLLYQLFYLPQDKRDTSNIIGSSYFKKSDFQEMLFSLTGSGPEPLDEDELVYLKEQIAKLQEDRKVALKRFRFAKSHPKISETVHKSTDRDAAECKKVLIKSINLRISDIRKDRSREISRKSKLESLITELNSLNRDLTVGRVVCGDCGSDKVIFKNSEFSFDASNQLVRTEILNSIRQQIIIKEETIQELTRNLNDEQDQLKKELESIPKEVLTLIIFTEEILSHAEIDELITNIDVTIQDLRGKLEASSRADAEARSVKSSITRSILNKMNELYRKLDPEGNLYFDELFTKRGETYSGSEEQEFYFAKIVAINEMLGLGFPIIVDSFRDGELSSEKEAFMIKTYSELPNQIILSSTLKQEEYSSSRYSNFKGVNAIDYSSNTTSHILNAESASVFTEIARNFHIEF